MATLSAKQIAKVAINVGFTGDGLRTAVAVALAASGGVADKVAGQRVGVWQILIGATGHTNWTQAWLEEASNNVLAAYNLSNGGASWKSFPVFTSGAYKAQLAAARAGVEAAGTGAGLVFAMAPALAGAASGGTGGGSSAGASAAAGGGAAATQDYDPRVKLGNIYLHGGKVPADIAAQVTSADVTWGTDQVTQLSIHLEDPGFLVYRGAYFEKGQPVLYREPGDGINPDVNLQFRIVGLTLHPGSAGTGGLDVVGRSQTVWALRRRRGALVMPKASPSDFVAAECKKVGAKYVVQPSPKRGHVARDVKQKGQEEQTGAAEVPSSWSTFVRLASELGYICYEYQDVVYFGKPTWLIAQDKTPMEVAIPQAGAPQLLVPRNMPTIDMSEDAVVPVTITDLEVEKRRFVGCHPGGGLKLSGLPPLNDVYLCTAMTYPLMGTAGLQLSAQTPKNPPKQPPTKTVAKGGKTATHDTDNTGTASSSGGATQVGGKSAAAFVAMAITASSAAYVYGAEASVSDAHPSALDCSELVQWALGRIGVPFVDGSTAQYDACQKISVAQAFTTKGALLHMDGHIGISMGDGTHSVEARNPTEGVGIFDGHQIAWTGGGLVPGLAYG